MKDVIKEIKEQVQITNIYFEMLKPTRKELQTEK